MLEISEIEQNSNSFSDLMYKWKFKEDDWLVNVVLSNPNVRFRIFRLKSYNSQEINNIIYDIYKDVKKYRTKLELNSKEFLEKKRYLTDPNNADKIQISLEDEYTLKYLIEMYKLYELISWFHIGKNDKIIKHCSIEKQKIIDKIYPIVGTTIEKVIGSKVIKPTLFKDISSKPNFDDAVNNAWFNIVKYLPKIDTSKPMFSIFVGTAQGSAKNFKLDSYKKEMNQINMSALERNDENMDEDKGIDDRLVEEAMQRKTYFYHKEEDKYDLLSALQKSVRGSDPDAAVHYLARLIKGGADIQTIGRRLLVMASEDVGMAYPQAITIVNSCVQAALTVGYPEAQINLAQATVTLAASPKSNRSYMALLKAQHDLDTIETGDMPAYLKDSHYKGAAKRGHGIGGKEIIDIVKRSKGKVDPVFTVDNDKAFA